MINETSNILNIYKSFNGEGALLNEKDRIHLDGNCKYFCAMSTSAGEFNLLKRDLCIDVFESSVDICYMIGLTD